MQAAGMARYAWRVFQQPSGKPHESHPEPHSGARRRHQPGAGRLQEGRGSRRDHARPGRRAASANPLLSASTLPFQAPQFDKIKDSDYLPAFEEGMRQHLAEIRKIADSSEPATFDNTIVAMEKRRDADPRVAHLLRPGPGRYQRAREDPGRSGAEAGRAPGRDQPRSQAVRAREEPVRPARHAEAGPGAEAPGRALLRGLRARRRAAVRRRQGSLRKLNVEETTLSTQFHTRWWRPPPPAPSSSTTRPSWPAWRGRSTTAAEAAKARKLDGKFLLPLQNTTQQPVLAR
jgi:peptidyl-dipeptidase Dcp